MLLLTDREVHGQRLSRDLALILPCTVVPVQQAGAQLATARVIVCDVALNEPSAVGLLRAALDRHRRPGIPLICLLREQTHHLVTQAKALDATDILPLDTPRAQLLNTIAQRAGWNAGEGATTPRRIASAGAQKAAAALAEMMLAAESGTWISPDTLEIASTAIIDAIARVEIEAWLDVVWAYDQVTYQHCLLVAGLAAFLSLKLGFSAADRKHLTEAALLHDIGKARVPLEILNKPGRLTDAEMEIMRTHAPIGFELLAKQGGFGGELLSVVRHHHEYLDGSGYPDGLQANEIIDLVRLTTICDIYAALIERRAYKSPMPAEQAFGIMWDMGGKLDADLLGAFQKLIVRKP
jgi:putative nucleotidyltransferase with HDIG domain